jgi:hypothetical protein
MAIVEIDDAVQPVADAMRANYTASLSSLAGRNALFLLGAILMAAAVAGFRPIRAARARTWRMPSSARQTLSPFLRWRVASGTKSPNQDFRLFWLQVTTLSQLGGNLLERDGGLRCSCSLALPF